MIQSFSHRKLFWALLAACMLSTLAVLPYAFNLQKEVIMKATVSLPVMIIGSVIQSALLFAIALYLGIKMASKMGLTIIPTQKIKGGKVAMIGVATGLAIVLGDHIFTQLGVRLTEKLSIPAWQGFLASFYGGIAEEILLRLFFMSLIAWIIGYITKKQAGKNAGIMWVSILVASIIFGLGHLPATATLAPLTAIIIARAVVLNGIGGIVFGWLYWKDSLLAAMVAHFSADIIIHVIAPALFNA
ncbi:CPBP family intramembrane metalloprotease [Candidatus Peregrinibacteria bacterium]|nr:MAG: CPBP family intramembrane metalloprotease [Candidatus Peregrinibacteria bacterium]